MPNAAEHITLPKSLRRRSRVWAGLFLVAVAILSLLAPLIANNRPLVVGYHGHIYFPVFQNLPGSTFGPQFLPTLADYANPETNAAILAHGWIVQPPIAYFYNTIVWNAPAAPAPPSPRNWLGTDAYSRDVLAQTIYGLRTACLLGFSATLAAAAFGILAGAIQGYYGGLADLIFQRFTEIWSGIPQFFLIIILAGMFTPSLWSLLLFLFVFSWMALAARVRAESLRARNLGFVQAAQMLGASNAHIIRHQVLPSAMIAVVTFLPFLFAESIILLASLDFLGFGQMPGSPSLGALLLQAKDNPQAPWLGITIFTTFAGILITLISIGGFLTNAPATRQRH